MPDPISDFDLKLLPDWLKEQPATNPYANYEGDTGERRGGGRPGGGRPRGDAGARKPGGGPGRDAGRGDRPRGPGPGGPKRHEAPRGPRGEGGQRHGGGGGRGRHQDDAARHDRPARKPFPAEIAFLPDPGLVEAIIKQIKTTAQAFPLFDLAKLFLAKPERHRIRFKALPGTALYQAGEGGPVSPDRSLLARAAFAAMKDQFYRTETVETEEIKGNFASVARCRATGKLLGPTNLHTYQPALRRHYGEHFAGKMPFEAFLRQIEVVSDPEAVERWKNEAKTKSLLHAIDETAPATFGSVADAERHFEATHFPSLLRKGEELDAPGTIASSKVDPATAEAIRWAWENTMRHPMPMMDALRPMLLAAGLIPFRNANRNQMFTAIRPRLFQAGGQQVSDGIQAILAAVGAQPGITRAALAERLIPQTLPEADQAAQKNTLAADLHWLVHSGHIIQYHDGTLEAARQIPKQDRPERTKKTKPAKQPATQGAAATSEPEAVTSEPEAAASEPEVAMSEPEAATSEPEAAMSEPEAATSEPEAVASEPEAAMSEPEAATSEPEAATSEPEPVASEPEAADEESSETPADDFSPEPSAEEPANPAS